MFRALQHSRLQTIAATFRDHPCIKISWMFFDAGPPRPSIRSKIQYSNQASVASSDATLAFMTCTKNCLKLASSVLGEARGQGDPSRSTDLMDRALLNYPCHFQISNKLDPELENQTSILAPLRAPNKNKIKKFNSKPRNLAITNFK